jgi:4-hydroxy-3-polyprenylbenzoate decarboxylase
LDRSPSPDKKIIVVGISGGSGVIYGIRLLEVLKRLRVNTHLVVTPAAKITIAAETDYNLGKVESLASISYRVNDIAAPISSGSFLVDGMVIIPCSMHTLGAIASGTADNLLTRAADVTLKERRTLVLVPRETPMSLIHLENMVRVASAGAVVMPATPAFYHRPRTLDDIVNHLVGKVLDQFKIKHDLFKRWHGLKASSSPLSSKGS